MSDVGPLRRWLSARNAAAYLDITVPTLYDWAGDGTIPGVVRIARRKPKGAGRHRVTIRIDKTKLDEFLERRAG